MIVLCHLIPLLDRLYSVVRDLRPWPLHANICLAAKSYASITLSLSDRSTSSLPNLSFTLNTESANNQSSTVVNPLKKPPCYHDTALKPHNYVMI